MFGGTGLGQPAGESADSQSDARLKTDRPENCIHSALKTEHSRKRPDRVQGLDPRARSSYLSSQLQIQISRAKIGNSRSFAVLVENR